VILIVAYRSVDKLELCLASIARFLPDNPIHIWDNSGSDFPGVREFAKLRPEIHWHLGGENIGFAAAVNKLAGAVPGHDLLLVNPDAELLGSLPLTRAAIQEPGIAAAAPLQWQPVAEDAAPPRRRRPSFWDRRQLPWDDVAYRKLTLLSAFGSVAGFSTRLRGSVFSISYRSQPTDVDGFLAGSCLAISREAWDRVGPFDEEFFMYQEEAEWQRRAITAGWRLRLADEVGARHSLKGTVINDPQRLTRSQDLAFANAVLIVEYCFGIRAAEAYLVLGAIVENLRRRRHGRGLPLPQPHDVLLTIDGEAATVEDRTAAALGLLQAGYSVCVVSLQRLGSLQRGLPPVVRLIRRPWWWPSIAPQGSPSFFVTGTTRRERLFTQLFRLRHPRIPILAVEDLLGLANEDRSDNGGAEPSPAG
jgi:GT2 family glycosyltransferase